VGLGKTGLRTRHLCAGQPEEIRHVHRSSSDPRPTLPDRSQWLLRLRISTPF
jgi:hypothetical protein